MFIKDRISVTSQRTYTDEGFLVVPAKIARTGIQDYLAIEMGLTDRDPTDVIRVLRPEKEVFNKDSLSSFANKPITNNHPTTLVNTTNAKELSIGHSGPEVVKDGIFASTVLHILDASAIKDIEDGKVELSNGYTSDIEWTPGITSDGESYDAIQCNIKGNHIALVSKGRCGSACKVSDTIPTKDLKEPKMATQNIDGVDFEVSDQAAQAIRKLQKRVSDAEEKTEKDEEELKKAKDEEEKAKAEAKKNEDKLQAKLDDAASKVPTPEALDTLVANRIATRDAALKIMPALKFEGKDCETIRKEVIADKCPDVDMGTVSAEYIRARFDALASVPVSDTLDSALALQLKKKTKAENSDKATTVSDARASFCERSRNAWKSGGTK